MNLARPRRLVAAFLSTVMAVALSGASVAPALAAPATPRIAWSPCYQAYGPFECGTVQVPLDYANPGAATISIAVVRLPAADPGSRIGSLFINPGGPGGSGVDFAVGAAPYLFTQAVRDRFDIVGFDPRGIARSTALRCFGTTRQWTGYYTPFAFPSTAEEEAVTASANAFLNDACEQRGTRIEDHMSTAEVARDLDLLRQAVGDAKLSYYGVSYGTFLGQTYANLFPDRFRALVIDGVLDPIAWTTGAPGEQDLPFSTRLRSDVGAQATLDEFFRLCDAGADNCPFAPDSAARYAALAQRIRETPIPFFDPVSGQTFEYDYSFLISDTLGSMYDSSGWWGFADWLAFLETQPGPAALGAGRDTFLRSIGLITKRGTPTYSNAIEGFPAVACSDSNGPHTYAAWSAAGAAADAAYGYFGRIWTWASSACAVWGGADTGRYLGPFDRATVAPVLVVGNLFDPATRYEGAVTAHGLLPNSALLTVHGWAHTSLFLSACADEAIGAYLIDGTTPAPGTVCEPDVVPFTTPMSAAGTSWADPGRAAARLTVRAGLMPEAVRLAAR